ncbi:MAG TPA: peptidase [Saprospiraceae bacterium]|nr:peptidase [Saprospiraceae bacterium]HMQ81667.1 peptidase [Saprospiraceae bacterium]
MTFCLGIRVKEGLIALADTRITSGNETTTSKKISLHSSEHGSLFLMTSGLRSIRDKAITYFEEVLEEEGGTYNKMYKAVNAFGVQLRRVAAEDKASLSASGLSFDLFTIVGGKLDHDKDHKLYLLYPEGNWIEIGNTTPFTIIGNSGYGQPILNRTLSYESSLRFALKTGFLSFDSTRVSANNVGYPIDIVLYVQKTGEIIEKRYEEADMKKISSIWDNKLSEIIKDIPEDWIDDLNTLSRQNQHSPLISYDQ